MIVLGGSWVRAACKSGAVKNGQYLAPWHVVSEQVLVYSLASDALTTMMYHNTVWNSAVCLARVYKLLQGNVCKGIDEAFWEQQQNVAEVGKDVV